MRLIGARFAAVTEADAVEAIVDAAVAERGHWTITANLDHLRRYRRELTAKQLIDDADLVVADGMPLVWASRLAGMPLPERVAGSNIIWSICQAASDRRQSVFLLGGNLGVAERAARILLDQYDGLEVAGTLCPPRGFEKDPQELDLIQSQLIKAAPQIVFVGLGFPKQDLLIRRLREALPSASFIGVGISLSFVAGEVSRAPDWMHGLGLEWFYRLWQEPQRLIRRYLVEGAPFALLLLASAARHRVCKRNKDIRWGWDTQH